MTDGGRRRRAENGTECPFDFNLGVQKAAFQIGSEWNGQTVILPVYFFSLSLSLGRNGKTHDLKIQMIL